MDVLSSILQLATPIGLAFIALIIVRENQKDRAAENTRRDNREDAERERQAKNDERFMLLFATLSGKQDASTSSIVKSGVDSESRVTQQTTTSEAAIKLRVQAVGDAQLSAIEALYKLTDSGFKSLLANPQDPIALANVQRAIELLTVKVQAVQDDLTGAKADIAINTEVGTANTSAITNAADALQAANVLATTEMPTVTLADAGAATEGGESTEAA